MKPITLFVTLLPIATLSVVGALSAQTPGPAASPVVAPVAAALPATASPADAKPAGPKLERGKYMVTVAGCNDCHTPFKMGEAGPEPDMSRMLSGHPETMRLPDPPQLPAPWAMVGAATNTAWAGPWGISFTANLTPDKETGLGDWTTQTFKDAIRTGRHQGRGRPILPPMPWPMYRNMTDEDLEAIFAFLQTIPAISNKVPEPVPPASTPGAAAEANGSK